MDPGVPAGPGGPLFDSGLQSRHSPFASIGEIARRDSVPIKKEKNREVRIASCKTDGKGRVTCHHPHVGSYPMRTRSSGTKR